MYMYIHVRMHECDNVYVHYNHNKEGSREYYSDEIENIEKVGNVERN